MDSMISNYREEANKRGLKHAHLTNEQFFNMIERNLGSTSEEDVEWTMEDLATNQPK